MNCLDYFGRSTKGQNTFEEVSPFTANDILEKNVESLDGDEKLIFNWMLLYYSDAWIAESLMLSRRQMKELTNTIFNKLKVKSKTNLLRGRCGHFLGPKIGHYKGDVACIHTKRELRQLSYSYNTI